MKTRGTNGSQTESPRYGRLESPRYSRVESRRDGASGGGGMNRSAGILACRTAAFPGCPAGVRSMTLLELIGVVAVLAVIGILAVTASISHLDQIASDQEVATLKALTGGLQASILRTRHIPGANDWASQIANELGQDISSVTNTPRNHARFLVADSSGWLATNFPYSQTCTGSVSRPDNARLMLVSSLGKDPPLANGFMNSSDFSALWDAPAGTVPSTGLWAGWNGRPDDVKVRKLNLTPLFVNLVLGTYTSNSNGQYAIDGSALQVAPKYYGVSAYYLQGTVLQLYGLSDTNASQVLQATQILNKDSSFVFESGVWKGSIEGGVTFGIGDVEGIVAAFLNATPNLNAVYGSTQQVAAVQAMINYMSNYDAWAAGSFSDNNLKQYLQNTVQPNLMTAVQGLYSGTNYPANSAACQ